MDKATVAPISHGAWDFEQFLPFTIGQGVTVERIPGLFSASHFELWRDYVSLNDRKDFESVRYALVHDFSSSEHLGKIEQDSHELVHRLFVLLRLVKPTRSRFSAVQVKRLDPKDPTRIEIFRFTHPIQVPLNIPEAETLNTVNPHDLETVRDLAPRFLETIARGPAYVGRAIRYYEEGYADIRDPALQFIIWLMGIECVVSREEEGVARDALQRKIAAAVPLDTNIYEHWGEYAYLPGPFPVLRLGEIIDDMFELRNRFAHGLWVPQQWISRVIFTRPGREAVSYADALRGAAAFLLRRLILIALSS